jgi:hypothetical protein
MYRSTARTPRSCSANVRRLNLTGNVHLAFIAFEAMFQYAMSTAYRAASNQQISCQSYPRPARRMHTAADFAQPTTLPHCAPWGGQGFAWHNSPVPEMSGYPHTRPLPVSNLRRARVAGSQRRDWLHYRSGSTISTCSSGRPALSSPFGGVDTHGTSVMPAAQDTLIFTIITADA